MPEIVIFIKKHILLNIALLGVLFALIFIEFIKQKSGTTKASPAQVTLLINHSNAKVIDIRSSTAYADGHIIGSISIPNNNLAEKSKSLLDKTKVQPIILVCANGQDSARAAATLNKEGFNVRILDGGIRAWREAEMPLVKG
ncbi:MAG: rhodanese-like domain-containing protein [Pseudomonadota bacterium]